MQTQINIYDRKRKTYAESYVTEEQHENIKKKKRIHEKEKSASIFGSPKDDKIKQRKREHLSKFRKNSSTDRVTKFKSQIRQGLSYICVVCNRCCLYRRSVIGFCANNYNAPSVTFISVKSFDDFKYICKICDSKVKKNKIPFQAVCNKLGIALLPEEF